MATTAAAAISLAQTLLHDPNGTNYTSAKLIPLAQKAYRELQLKLTRAGISVCREQSASQTVTAGTTALTDGGGLPADFIHPIELKERGSASEAWSPMIEQAWEPDTDMGSTLRYYAFREEQIHFVGCTTDRLLYMRYWKGLTPITATTTPLGILDCDVWLASRTAAIAALVIGENPSRADALNQDANLLFEDLKGMRTKGRQGMPVRRRVNRYRQ